MSLLQIIANLSKGTGTTPPVSLPAGMGAFINDSFSTYSGYTALNPAYQTITPASNSLSVTGKSTAKNAGLAISKTGYGKSTLRNYKVSTTFTLHNTGGTNYGVFVGVQSQRNPGQNCTTYIFFDTVANTLEIAGVSSAHTIGVTNGSSPITEVGINTSDTYTLTCEVVEDVVTGTLVNTTTGQSKSISYTYNFSTLYTGNQVKPNIFYYAFGVNGSTAATFYNFSVSSTELDKPDILFLGDSITTGYYGGTCLNTYAYKLRSHTAKKIQVMAGGYNKAQDVYDNLPEILAREPETAFIMIGTNDGASAGAFTTLQNIITQLTTAGITVIPLLIPDGGNPATAGTYNEKIKTAYPSTYIDTWTTGFSTMSTGNGEMIDTVHPTNSGYTKLANLIKAARPALFTL